MGKRTQVTLTDWQHAFLLDEASRSGLSMAELVRRAIEQTYRPNVRRVVRGYEVNVNVWKNPDAAAVGRRLRAFATRSG